MSRRRYVPESPTTSRGASLEARSLAAPLPLLWHRYNPLGTLDGVQSSVTTTGGSPVGQTTSDYTIDPLDPLAPAPVQGATATWTLSQTNSSMYGSVTYSNTGTVQNEIRGDQDPLIPTDVNAVNVNVTSSGVQNISGSGYGGGAPTLILSLAASGYRHFYFSPTPNSPPPSTVALIEHFHVEWDPPATAVMDGKMSFNSTSANLTFGAGQTPIFFPHASQTNYPWTSTTLSQSTSGNWSSIGPGNGYFDATVKTVFVTPPGHSVPTPTTPPAPDWTIGYSSGFTTQVNNVHVHDSESMQFHYDATFVPNP